MNFTTITSTRNFTMTMMTRGSMKMKVRTRSIATPPFIDAKGRKEGNG